MRAGTDVMYCGRGWIYGRGDLTIGGHSWISPGLTVHTHPSAPIVIGSNCDIGPGVELIPGGHEIGASSRRAGLGTAKSIWIGDGSWIGARTIVLGGVCIGEGSVVAAGSVVIHDVPPHVLVAGVPARFKRELPR